MYTDRLKWPLGTVLGHLCTLLQRSRQWTILWGSVWASAKMSRAAPQDSVASLGWPAASAVFLAWVQVRSLAPGSAA